jgi:hypothetical protein
VEFQVIHEAFWRIFGSSSSIGKKKTEKTPTLKLNIVTGSLGSNPERVDLIIYFRLTNRGRCLQILALEMWGEKVCFGRRVAAYRFKAEGDFTVFVCEIPY